jgi:AcrR family transcriptional regulator
MKIDRRKQRTRALLRDSLIALILEKGYDAVTVQDITDRANLGRATFYLHYKGGKDELLLSMMEGIQADVMQQAGPVSPNGFLEDGNPPSLHAFKHAEDNADFYKAMLGGGGLASLITRFRKSSAAQIQEQMNPVFAAHLNDLTVDVISNFVVGALNTLVIWWLENDRPYPAEDIARIYHHLVMTGIQGMLDDPANSLENVAKAQDSSKS